MMDRHSLMIGFAFFCSALCLTCVGEVGPQGSTGPPGPVGSKGESGASATGFPDCPIGYDRDFSIPTITLCKQGSDEVVKVGRKGSAFWIDRYEASIWDTEDGSGKQFGATASDYPASFPRNGQLTVPLFALSKANVTPSRFLTWFQANEACRANGKRLPTGDEWLAAARGTTDPGSAPGTSAECVTSAGGPRNTGSGVKCISDWGAQDMIGNLTEWTADWFGTVTNPGSFQNAWPDNSYNGDVTRGISSIARGGNTGVPSAALRGGEFSLGTENGIFLLDLVAAPSYGGDLSVGFRCVVPR